MKKLLLALLATAGLALGQSITVQKNPHTGSNPDELTSSSKIIVVGNGGSITATGTGQIIATGGAASTLPWSGLTAIPSPTFSLTGDGTTATTLLASGGATSALTLATVNSNVGTYAATTVNGKGLVTAASDLYGDLTTSGAVATLATVNANVGSFGSSTAIPSFTVNGKGLITAAGTNVVIAPAGTLTGTTLASNVVSSSLTGLGTVTSGAWNASVIPGQYGGTGVANTGKTLTLGGNLTTSGAFDSTFTMTAPTSVTFPTSGTLATVAGTVSSITGTANQITASQPTGAVTLSLPTAVAGVNSLTSASGNNGLTLASTGTGNLTLTPGTTGTILPGGNITFTAGNSITSASGNNTLSLAATGTGVVQVFGSTLYVNKSTDASSTTTGGFQATGGGGFQGKVWATGLYSVASANAMNVAAGVTPFTELEVDSTSTSSPRGVMSAQFNTGTDGARMHFRKARGTRASPTTVVSGDNLGRLVGSGYDGASYLEDATIIFGTEGTVASTRIPTNISFWTATDAAPSVLTQRLLIDSAGLLTVASGNVSAASATNLTLNGGSSGASLALGQGTNGSAVVTLTGNGVLNAGAATQKVAFNSGAMAFNRNPSLGTIYDNTIHGFQWTHTGSATPSTDYIALGTFQPGGANISNSALVITATPNVLIGGAVDITGSGGLKVFGTTASTSTTTGSLINAGGFGNAGSAYIGGSVRIANANYGTAAGSIDIQDSSDSSLRLWRTTNEFVQLAASRNGITGVNNQISFDVSGTSSAQVRPISFRSSDDGYSTKTEYLRVRGPSSDSAWGTAGVQSRWGSATYTDSSTAGSGTAASAVFHSFAVPTLAATNTSVTTTDAATVYIAGAPTAGTNQTITNGYGLWNVGKTRLDGIINSTANGVNIFNAGSGSDAPELVSLRNNSGVGYVMRPAYAGGTLYAWRVDANVAASQTFSITPSTAVGGSTFSTPLLKLAADTGAMTLGSTASVVSVPGTTASTSTSTGAFIVANKFAVGGASGNVYAAGDINGAGILSIVPQNIGGAGQIAAGITPTFTSAATNNGRSLYLKNTTTAASFAMSNGYGLYVDTTTIGAASSIGTQRGIYIENQGASGITTAYGIDIAAQSGAASTNVGLRNAGTTILTNATASTSVSTGAFVVNNLFAVGGASGNVNMGGLVGTYNNLATAGNGIVSVQGAGRATGQTAANASVATYTVGASDASFVVSANVRVTTSSAEAFTVTCDYTDEGNTARTATLNFQLIAGTIGTAINFANGAVPYEGLPIHIRAKAATAITVKTAAGGTYTGCTYNVEGVITKLQ